METSMGFLYQLLPFTFNVRKNECFVCKLLIGFLRKFNRLISQIKWLVSRVRKKSISLLVGYSLEKKICSRVIMISLFCLCNIDYLTHWPLLISTTSKGPTEKCARYLQMMTQLEPLSRQKGNGKSFHETHNRLIHWPPLISTTSKGQTEKCARFFAYR